MQPSRALVGIAQAEAETMIQPDRMLDDLGWKADAAAGIGRGRHAPHAAASAMFVNLTTPLE